MLYNNLFSTADVLTVNINWNMVIISCMLGVGGGLTYTTGKALTENFEFKILRLTYLPDCDWYATVYGIYFNTTERYA